MEPATAADVDAVVALWTACGLVRPWNDPHADFARAIANPASAVLVVREREAITASAMVGYDGHRGWVYYLAVAPDRRGQGLGRAAMAAAEDWLRGREAPKIQFMIRDGNGAAIGFYRALDYEAQPVAVFGRFLD